MPNAHMSGPLVVALVYDQLCTFEFAIVAEIFGLHRPEMGDGWYRFASAAIETGPLRAHGGLNIVCDGDLTLLETADIVVMPGWKGVGVEAPASLLAALRAAHKRGARLASICSGAFVLAATGLLSGQRAATHWRYAESLSRLHPDITVDADSLYAEADRIYTSAGSAAGIDLMLHIVRQEFGVAAANSVARRLVMPPHRNGGQAQFIERPVPATHFGKLASLLDDIRAAPHADWSIDTMAKQVSASRRTFIRRFIATTGQAPGEWVTQIRLDEARRLLEATSIALDEVAERAGFGSVETMRRHFRAKVGIAPKNYRDAFASR
jgi:AraC family transcriptional regulator, transcriptional activator FtrA